MEDVEDKIIRGWYCRLCRRRYWHSGLCEDCGEFLRPIVPVIPPGPMGSEL